MKDIVRAGTLMAACAIAAVSASASAYGAEAGGSADELLGAAQHALQQIDAGQYAALWQETAPFVRAKYAAGGFESGLAALRQSVGDVDHRGWASVTRLTYSHDQVVPDGLYANVDYATWLRGGRIVYEKVSFQLGSDGRWHFTGYAPRQTQNESPQVHAGQAAQ